MVRDFQAFIIPRLVHFPEWWTRCLRCGILVPMMPLFALPLISVLIAPVAALVLLKLIQTFVPIRRFPTVWVSVTYVLLIIQAVGISVMLSRSLPNH